MAENNLIGYMPKETPLHRLSGSTKLLCFLMISIIGMISYDTRFLLLLAVLSIVLFRTAKIKYREISFVVKFIVFFSVLNLVTVYVFAPEYGVTVYGTRHVIFEGIGRYTLTQEQLLYELNLLIKYFVTIPPGLLFILTTNPSELASSIHRVGGSYKIAYAFSLALRYIPDIQENFRTISKAQQARGSELSGKAPLMKRVWGNLAIAIPLIFSSLERIETISSAMELRRFGKKKGRTWLSAKPLKQRDYLTLFIVVLLCLLGIFLLYHNGGRFYNPFH